VTVRAFRGMKQIFIILNLCTLTTLGQTEEELRALNKIIDMGDWLYENNKFSDAKRLWERAYNLCQCTKASERLILFNSNTILAKELANKRREKTYEFYSNLN